MKAIDQQYMRDYGKVIPEAQRQEHLKKLWERAMKKTHHKVSVKLKEKRKLEGNSRNNCRRAQERSYTGC